METKPLCPYFGKCGGCTSQHIAYALQAENKKQMVVNELKKNDINFPPDVKLISGKDYFYRNRMDFVFSKDGPGLREKGRFMDIVQIRKCVISNDKINKLLDEVWQWFNVNKDKLDVFDVKRNIGTLRYSVIRASENTDSSTITFILNDDSNKIAEHSELIREFADKTSAENVIIGRVPKNTDLSTSADSFEVKGSIKIEENVLGNKIVFHSQSFFQNNSKMAEEMVGYCKELLEKNNTKDATLVDLYGGAGTFGICLSEIFKKTMIIDSEGLNIDCAKENVEGNDKIEAIACDAASIQKLNIKEKELFMITDPPRSGMHPKAIANIVNLKPKILIYVSCNPQQMAKELKTFQKYYDIDSVAVFDLFPQTPHTEAVVEMKLKN